MGQIHNRANPDFGKGSDVTELDKKLAAITIKDIIDPGVSNSDEDLRPYLEEVTALIELGWRPVHVNVTGNKPKFDPHPQPGTPGWWGQTPRDGILPVGPIARGAETGQTFNTGEVQ